MKEKSSDDVQEMNTQTVDKKELIQEETYDVSSPGTVYLTTRVEGDNIINDWDFVPKEEVEITNDDDFYGEYNMHLNE